MTSGNEEIRISVLVVRRPGTRQGAHADAGRLAGLLWQELSGRPGYRRPQSVQARARPHTWLWLALALVCAMSAGYLIALGLQL